MSWFGRVIGQWAGRWFGYGRQSISLVGDIEIIPQQFGVELSQEILLASVTAALQQISITETALSAALDSYVYEFDITAPIRVITLAPITLQSTIIADELDFTNTESHNRAIAISADNMAAVINGAENGVTL